MRLLFEIVELGGFVTNFKNFYDETKAFNSMAKFCYLVPCFA